MGMLTERDINLYNESGYVVPDFQLDAEFVEELLHNVHHVWPTELYGEL